MDLLDKFADATPLTRRAVFARAWPIVLGQALIPLTGIVDATVIGRAGSAAPLAGVALGATVINLVFWAFGFLRMGVTGLTAQADGASDAGEVLAILMRSLGLGVALGVLLLLLSPLIAPIALRAMAVPETAAGGAHAFVQARFFGAPGALGFYSINGWLLGLGRTRLALTCQIAMNGVNIVLDLMFVGWFGMGARGVGIGTALAEWSALAAGLIVAAYLLRQSGWQGSRPHGLFAWTPMRRLIVVNFDIMVRTLALLLLFTWFTRAGARLGTVPLAANHVLMQLISVSAFVLDGFAFTAEQRVGAAIGAGSRPAVRRAIRLTGELSLGGGAAFAVLIALAGPALVLFVAKDMAVREQARAILPFCAMVPLLGMPSWLLDGIFIGATRGPTLRNAALAATILYLVTDLALRPLGDAGVWIALLASYVYRAMLLGLALPRLLRVSRKPQTSGRIVGQSE